MTENDKKLMNGCYIAELRTNALDAKPSTAKGFIRGYEKASSLHVVMQQSLNGLGEQQALSKITGSLTRIVCFENLAINESMNVIVNEHSSPFIASVLTKCFITSVMICATNIMTLMEKFELN